MMSWTGGFPSPRVPRLRKPGRALASIARADSVTVDGHKWLNVPYDCGFALVRDPALLARAFVYDAAYLPDPSDERPVLGSIGPESSRRARSLAVWATLRAYGRTGVRAWVERHLDLAQRLARAVDAADDLERLADVSSHIEGHTICAFGEAAAWPVQGFLQHFWPEFEYFVEHGRSFVESGGDARLS